MRMSRDAPCWVLACLPCKSRSMSFLAKANFVAKTSPVIPYFALQEDDIVIIGPPAPLSSDAPFVS